MLQKNMDHHISLVAICLFIVVGDCQCKDDFVEMKIVDEPSVLGFQQNYGSNFNQEEELKLRVQPANFSGPLHFKRLIGRCFHSILNDYKYSFCPFSNVTQHEQNVHWNPYKGVLGVWQEWEVNDNKFSAMLMKDGDSCGDIFRSVKIIFLCGNHSKLMNATEPMRCSYELLFMTPLVCIEDAMLVYPTLSQDLRSQWDLLEGEKAAGDLTDKGYKQRLTTIFENAGIYLSGRNRKALAKKVETIHEQQGDYDNLITCNSAYKILKEQNEALKQQLRSHNISDHTTTV